MEHLGLIYILYIQIESQTNLFPRHVVASRLYAFTTFLDWSKVPVASTLVPEIIALPPIAPPPTALPPTWEFDIGTTSQALQHGSTGKTHWLRGTMQVCEKRLNICKTLYYICSCHQGLVCCTNQNHIQQIQRIQGFSQLQQHVPGPSKGCQSCS